MGNPLNILSRTIQQSGIHKIKEEGVVYWNCSNRGHGQASDDVDEEEAG